MVYAIDWKFEVSKIFFLKALILLFSMDALNWSKVIENAFMMLKKTYFKNRIHQEILEKNIRVHRNKLHFKMLKWKKKKILNSNILHFYCLYNIFDQIHAALVSIRDLFQKQKILSTKLLNSNICIYSEMA